MTERDELVRLRTDIQDAERRITAILADLSDRYAVDVESVELDVERKMDGLPAYHVELQAFVRRPPAVASGGG